MLSTEPQVYAQQAEEANIVADYPSNRSGVRFLSATHLDQSLMAQIGAREVEALALLYDRYAAQLYTLALHCTGNTGTAEKIVIDVFHQIWHSADNLVVSTDIASWLIALTRQHAISLLKGLAGQHTAVEASLEQFGTSQQVPQPCQHEAMKIRLALQSLPVAQRMSIEMAYYSGLSQAEIANKLDHPPQMVQRNLRQGLLSLRDRLFGK